MMEVLKALQELNVRWKKIGHYNMKCRWLPGNIGHSEDTLTSHMHVNQGRDEESAVLEGDDATGNSYIVVKFELQVCSIFLYVYIVVSKNCDILYAKNHQVVFVYIVLGRVFDICEELSSCKLWAKKFVSFCLLIGLDFAAL